MKIEQNKTFEEWCKDQNIDPQKEAERMIGIIDDDFAMLKKSEDWPKYRLEIATKLLKDATT